MSQIRTGENLSFFVWLFLIEHSFRRAHSLTANPAARRATLCTTDHDQNIRQSHPTQAASVL